MNRKIALMLLAAAVLLVSVGCRKEGATGPKKSARAPSQGKAGAPESAPPTTVGGQQPGGGTAQAPAGGTARQPAGGTAQQPPESAKQPGATAGGTEANQPAAPGTTPTPTTPASTKSQSGTKK